MRRVPSFDRKWQALSADERHLVRLAFRQAQASPRLVVRRTVPCRLGRWRLAIHSLEVGRVRLLLCDVPASGALILLDADIGSERKPNPPRQDRRRPIAARLSRAYRQALLSEALAACPPRR